MSPIAISHILRRSIRSLWENLYLNLVSSAVIGMTVLLLGVFVTVIFNLDNITKEWAQDVHISAYFRAGIPVERRFELLDEISALEGIQSATYVSEEQAQTYMIERLPEVKEVFSELDSEILPSSLEITLIDSWSRPDTVRKVAESLNYPEFEDLDYGQEWVERFNSFLSLLKLLGVIFGGLLSLASIFMIVNTIHLTVYSRRAELETMRLVGATDFFIIIPFLVEGLVQGLVGSALALGSILVIHNWIILRLQQSLELAITDNPLLFLPWSMMGGLILIGCVFGLIGSYIAVNRFLRRIV